MDEKTLLRWWLLTIVDKQIEKKDICISKISDSERVGEREKGRERDTSQSCMQRKL